MTANPIDDLRAALSVHDDWPTDTTAAVVLDHARRLINAVDMHAAVITHHRQHVTPTDEAVSAVLNAARPAHCTLATHLRCTHPCCTCDNTDRR